VHIAGPWRFATVICKDFLDPHVARALIRAGVNALAVPAFSEVTDGYISVTGEHVRQTQGLVVVANNPARFDGQVPVVPAAMIGQPCAGAYTVTWPARGPRPDERGLVIFHLGQTVGTWKTI
jgi:hypothetical protein